MSYIIKAEHVSDSSTSKKSHIVSDIAVKLRENRSDKPETFYHISPPKKTADEVVFYLGDSSVDSGELGAEFATKLKLYNPEIKLYTLEIDDDDNIFTHEAAKKRHYQLQNQRLAKLPALSRWEVTHHLPSIHFSRLPQRATLKPLVLVNRSRLPTDSGVDTGVLSTVARALNFPLSAIQRPANQFVCLWCVENT